MKILLLALFAMVILNAKDLPIVSMEVIAIDHVEPSGVAISPADKKIVVVGDEGSLTHIDPETTTTFSTDEDFDLEGITFVPDFPNLYFAALEGDDDIIIFNREGLEVNRFNINRKFNGKKVIKKKGNGLESITFFKKDEQYTYFFVANQSDEFEGNDRSAIMIIQIRSADIPKRDNRERAGRIVQYFPMTIPDISGLSYQNGYLFLISDTNNQLYVFDKEINLIDQFFLPGDDQEGIVFDGNTLYIAQDSGGLLKIVLEGFPYIQDTQ